MDRKLFTYSVVAAIIATFVFSYCLEPATVWAWHILASTSNSIFTSMQDSAVKSAALGKRDWIDTLFLCYFNAALLGLATSYIGGPILKHLAKRFLNRHPNGEQKQPKRLRIRPFLKSLYYAAAIPIFILSISSTELSFSAYVDLQMNASFSQRLDALAPFIDDHRQKQLRSEWAMMETLNDYRRVTTEMDQLGQQADIKLPKLLYK